MRKLLAACALLALFGSTALAQPDIVELYERAEMTGWVVGATETCKIISSEEVDAIRTGLVRSGSRIGRDVGDEPDPQIGNSFIQYFNSGIERYRRMDPPTSEYCARLADSPTTRLTKKTAAGEIAFFDLLNRIARSVRESR